MKKYFILLCIVTIWSVITSPSDEFATVACLMENLILITVAWILGKKDCTPFRPIQTRKNQNLNTHAQTEKNNT
jgi:hypothetical protein